MAFVPGSITALVFGVVGAGKRVATALAHRRASRELLEWDARGLKDIGLLRGDLASALDAPLTKDPTLVLAGLAAGRTPRTGETDAGACSAKAVERTRMRRSSDLPSAGPAFFSPKAC